MKNVSQILQIIIYIVLLYFILFMPPIVIGGFRFYTYQLVRAVAIFYVFFHAKAFSRFCKRFSHEISLMLVIVAFVTFRGLVNANTTEVQKAIIGVFTLIVVPFFFVDYGRKIGVSKSDEIVKYLTTTAAIATAISIAAFFVPSVNTFIRDVLVRYGDLGLQEGYEQRGFGWGLYMTSQYGFVLAMLTIIGLFYLKNVKWFVFVIPFAFIACLINARTGVVIGVTGLIIYFFYSGRWIYSLITIIAGLFVYSNLYDIIILVSGHNDAANQWLLDGYYTVQDYSKGDYSSGVLGTLFDEVFFPDSAFAWVFGYGEILFSKNSLGIHSDIGFINQLFYGGLIYCIMLYTLVARVYRRIRINNKALSLFILASFFIINFKGDFVFNTPSFGLTMLLYYALYTYDIQKKTVASNVSKKLILNNENSGITYMS